MSTTENKTQITDVDPAGFIAAIEHPVRRADALTLLELMSRVSGEEARMWGPSIIGFGQYHYRYESGREGDFLRLGFSPRKSGLVVYMLAPETESSLILDRLGKFKNGKSCLYITRLADIDLGVLEELLAARLEFMARKYLA